MKNIILLIVACPLFSNGQTFHNTVFDDLYNNKSTITDRAVFQDSITVLSGFANKESCRRQILHAVLPSGEILWNKRDYHEVLYTDSNSIYSAGRSNLDGDIDVNSTVVTRYSPTGNKLLELESKEDFHSNHPPVLNIHVAPDSTILVSHFNMIFKGSKQSDFLRQYTPDCSKPISNVYGVTSLKYLIQAQNIMYFTDSAFTVTDSIVLNETPVNVKLKNDSIYFLFESSLLRADTGLNVWDTIVQYPAVFSRMKFYHNQIWIQTARTDSLEVLMVKPSNENEFVTLPLFVKEPEIMPLNSHYAVSGNSFSDQKGFYAIEKSFENYDEVNLHDIELTNFEIDRIKLSYVELDGNEFARGYSFRATLHVKNNGAEDIDSIASYSLLRGGMNCGRNIHYHASRNTKIKPGETQKIHLTGIYQDRHSNTDEICFEILAPNSELEFQTENNSLCKTFEITGVNNYTEPEVRIFPNPATDKLIIENSATNTQNVTLSGLDGKTVLSKTANSNRTEINLHSVSPGVYILKINTGKNIITRKIVKK